MAWNLDRFPTGKHVDGEEEKIYHHVMDRFEELLKDERFIPVCDTSLLKRTVLTVGREFPTGYTVQVISVNEVNKTVVCEDPQSHRRETIPIANIRDANLLNKELKKSYLD